MLKPGSGKTHRAYMWSYCTPSSNVTKAVVFDFSETRSGENVREFLRLDTDGAWKGTLVTDGFSGYRGCIEKGVTSAQCMAHARRKFFDARETDGRRAAEALRLIQRLYRVEAAIRKRIARRQEAEPTLPAEARHEITRAARQRVRLRVLARVRAWLDREKGLVPYTPGRFVFLPSGDPVHV